MPRIAVTKRIERTQAAGYLGTGKPFVVAAEALRVPAGEDESCGNAIALLAVHAAIAHVDAPTIAFAERRSCSGDHRHAARLLRDVLGNQLPEKQERPLLSMLNAKDTETYQGKYFALSDAVELLAKASTLAVWAEDRFHARPLWAIEARAPIPGLHKRVAPTSVRVSPRARCGSAPQIAGTTIAKAKCLRMERLRMSIEERRAVYRRIEELRGRPLIVYVTSTRPNATTNIAADAVREFIDQIDAIPADSTEVDVLIHSMGGDALAAWKLMSVLRERFSRVFVLVPYMAFSAATIFALGADEIVMHPHASLGPIDPQILMSRQDGSRRQFAFEDVGAFLRFLNEEVGITEQAHLSAIVDRLFTEVDPVNVGAAKRASELATDVGERLLRMHMTGPEERGRARAIAEGLNKSFFAHGDAVSRTRADSLDLRVAPANPPLEKLLWKAFELLEAHMELREPFVPTHAYLRGRQTQLPTTPGPLLLPSNAPQQLLQQVWNAAAQQALQNAQVGEPPVPFAIVHAVVESTRAASTIVSEGLLQLLGFIDGQPRVEAMVTASGWRTVADTLPDAPPAP